MPINEELKNCPFCGAPAQRHVVVTDGDNHIRCGSIACKVHPITKAGVKTMEEAESIWNQRP